MRIQEFKWKPMQLQKTRYENALKLIFQKKVTAYLTDFILLITQLI